MCEHPRSWSLAQAHPMHKGLCRGHGGSVWLFTYRANTFSRTVRWKGPSTKLCAFNTWCPGVKYWTQGKLGIDRHQSVNSASGTCVSTQTAYTLTCATPTWSSNVRSVRLRLAAVAACSRTKWLCERKPSGLQTKLRPGGRAACPCAYARLRVAFGRSYPTRGAVQPEEPPRVEHWQADPTAQLQPERQGTQPPAGRGCEVRFPSTWRPWFCGPGSGSDDDITLRHFGQQNRRSPPPGAMPAGRPPSPFCGPLRALPSTVPRPASETVRERVSKA